MFWMLICASIRWYHLFSQISRESVCYDVMIYELVLRNFDCSLEFVFSLLLLQPFNVSPVSFACNFQDWGCVILREIDFLLKICWSIPCLHPSWKAHTWTAIFTCQFKTNVITLRTRYQRAWQLASVRRTPAKHRFISEILGRLANQVCLCQNAKTPSQCCSFIWP